MDIILKNHFLSYAKTRLKDLYRYRYARYLTILLSFLLVFYLTLCLAVSYLDPNQYKDKMTAWIFEKTGETLVIDGNVQFSVFPSLVLEAEKVSLKPKQQSQKSTANPVLKAEQLRIYPEFWSLIFNKPISQIELLDLRWNEYKIRHLKTKYQFNENVSEFFVTKIWLNTGKTEELIEIDYLKMDTQSVLPKYSLKHQSNHFPLHFFLTLLESETHVTGSTSVNFDLTSEGITKEQITDNLNGQFEIELKQGKIHGLNVLATLKEARSLLQSLTSKLTSNLTLAYNTLIPRKEKNPGSTAYENIKIIASVQNGVISKDLNVRHHHYHLKGSGKINLRNNTIDCLLEARYKEHGVIREEHLAQSGLIPLKIYIRGNLHKPNIKADFDSYIKFISQRASSHKRKPNFSKN